MAIRSLYFAYGTNMAAEQMARRCETAQRLGWGWLNGYQMVFGTGGFATVIKKPGAKTPVAIWAVTQKDMKHLDNYEGCPIYYRREVVSVELADSSVWGNLYVNDDGTVDAEIHPKEVQGEVYIMQGSYCVDYPGLHATEVARTGYRELGINEKHIDEAVEMSFEYANRYIREVEGSWQKPKQ